MKSILEFIGLIAVMFIVMIITALCLIVFISIYIRQSVLYLNTFTYLTVSLNVEKLRIPNDKIIKRV